MSAPVIRKFALFAPYITTASAQELRSKLYPAHKAGLTEQRAKGVLKFGGPVWNDEGAGEALADASARPYGGSFFLYEGENRAAVMEIIKQDAYWTGGLWDKSSLRLVEYNPLSGYPF